MRLSLHSAAFVVAVTMMLAACGGSGSSGVASAPTPPPTLSPSPPPTPTPTPAPSPTPTPPPFQPVAATIFPDPLYNPDLAVAGKGWQYDYVPNTGGALNLRDADGLSVTYDQATNSYRITVPVAGSGTIMRTGEYTTYPFSYPSALPGFHADPSNKNPTNYCCNALSLSAADRPQSRYSYVSFVDFYAPAPAGSNLDTIAYGTFAVGQPTKPGEVPTTGSATYSGNLFGHFAGDAGATWLEGKATFDFDFARALLSGGLTVGLRCMMGCTYDEVSYQFAQTNFARGSTTFSGQVTTSGAPSAGTFSGLFAGPGAVELMSKFHMPFFNPEYQRWMDAGGAIAAKRD